MSLVSVILPTFNRRHALERAYRSVAAQTFSDWDLWIIDDHSTDGTEKWLRQLGAEESRVRVLRLTENRGVSHARNAGIQASRGAWLALLDSDDEWKPEKLERQLALSRRHPTLRLLHTDEVWVRRGVRVNPHRKHYKCGGQIFKDCVDMCRISPSAVMLHRTLLEQYGLFDESLPVCEDYDLWLRLTRYESVGFCEDKLTIKHGGHEDQLSARYHSMDYWRLKSLSRYFSDEGLEPAHRQYVLTTALKKAEILLAGYRKHQNLDHIDEVTKFRDRAELHLKEIFKSVL